MSGRREARASEAQVGQSFARVIAELFAVDAERATGLIEEGAVFVGGRRLRDPEACAKLGDRLILHLRGPAEAAPELPPIRVIFEDASILVLDKAPGDHLNETETSLHPALVERLRPKYPELLVVHRLDRETSGVVLLAKTAASARALSEAFRERRVKKRYLAIVEGSAPEGTVEAAIGDDPKRPRARRVVTTGKPSTTTFACLATVDGLSSVLAEPLTGRTHQIRVHLSHRGAPIVGDRLYGGPQVVRIGGEVVRAERTLLHALRLELEGHTFTAPIPEDLARFERYGLKLS